MRTALLICLCVLQATAVLAQEPAQPEIIDVTPADPVASDPVEVAVPSEEGRADASVAQPASARGGIDAPNRVARVSLLQGEVSIAPAGTEEWSEAELNRPLTSGDRVWVERDGRAELQLGATSIHLDQQTDLAFITLDDAVMDLSLAEGVATIRVHRKIQGERLEIGTPNGTVALLRPGEYHIEVNEAGDRTTVKTRTGEAEVRGGGASHLVRANQAGVFTGGEHLTATMSALGPRTAFENWANERDAREQRAVAARHVSRDVIGYEDLDDHGDWIEEPEYGYVWAPRYVVAGWAPYRQGRWRWVSPWGWTWVDAAPWGFAPFHYGRWTYLRSRWCWVPGPRHLRPVYAPALVGWLGGPRVGVSVSFGTGVGWFPLGPREIYVPGYWHTRRYIHNVNVSNTLIVNNIYLTDAYRGRHDRFDYRHRHLSHAVTRIHRDAFVGSRPVFGHHSPLSDRELRRWHHDARPPAIAPNRNSVVGQRVRRDLQVTRDHAVTRHHPGRVFGNQRAGRVSFDAERRAVAANGGRPVPATMLFRNSDDRIAETPVRDARRSTGFQSPGAIFGSRSQRSESTRDVDRSRRDSELSVNRDRPTRRDDSVRWNGRPQARESQAGEVGSAPVWRGSERRERAPETQAQPRYQQPRVLGNERSERRVLRERFERREHNIDPGMQRQERGRVQEQVRSRVQERSERSEPPRQEHRQQRSAPERSAPRERSQSNEGRGQRFRELREQVRER